MKVPLIDLNSQYLTMKKEILNSIEKVLDSSVYISGQQVKQFEQEIASFTNSKFAISTANGTDSLVIALQALGIKEGDEVITSPYTFFASAEAIARLGAIPVFADINPRTYNLSPSKVEEKITSKTKAIIPVHIFGQPADMDEFMRLGKQYNLFIIEDACQALGASYKGRKVGSIGDVGCVSFFPTKNLGGYGDGGIVLTNDKYLAEKIRLLSMHGSSRKYYHELVGYNSRLDEIQAAILRIKLKRLDHWNQLRCEKANFYLYTLKNLNVVLPFANDWVDHVYHLFIIQSKRREELANYLQNLGIGTGHYYPCPLHLQKAFKYLGYSKGDLPVAENLCETALALPLYPELKNEQQQYVVSSIIDFYQGK